MAFSARASRSGFVQESASASSSFGSPILRDGSLHGSLQPMRTNTSQHKDSRSGSKLSRKRTCLETGELYLAERGAYEGDTYRARRATHDKLGQSESGRYRCHQNAG